MRRLGLILTGGALGTAGMLVVYSQEPEWTFDKIVARGFTLADSVSEDGKTLRLNQSTTGEVTEILIEGPAKVSRDGGAMKVRFGGTVPTPTPSAPTPSPSEPPPSPSDPPPSDPPTPPPGPCQYGFNIPVAGQPQTCLPAPKQVLCSPLPDDPVGLLRIGPGCDARGGSGTGIIKVTALGPDGAPGTLRDSFKKISPTQRRVVFDASLQGDVVLDTPLYWNRSYTTLDFGPADVRVTVSKAAMNGIVFTAAHDVIVYSGRGSGKWKVDPKWIPTNNTGMFAIDGDGGPPNPPDPFDDRPPQRSFTDFIFDRNATDHVGDDGLGSVWEGVQRGSFLRGISRDSFHPNTCGAKGTPLPIGRERLDLLWWGGAWVRNGERNGCYAREEIYRWQVARNIFYDWRKYPYWDTAKNATDYTVPAGLHISDMFANENDLGWITDNIFIPGADNIQWGVTIGEKLGCELAHLCCAPSCTPLDGKDIACCNPRMVKTRWWFKGNTQVSPANTLIEAVTNPPGYVPTFSLGYNLPMPSWDTVLDQLGPVRRRPEEQQLVDELRAKIP